MKTIIIGTGNKAKVAEVHKYLGDLDVDWKTLADVAPGFDVEETEITFEGNAKKKALDIAKHTGLPTISGDGGLEIPALDNWPGLKSKRVKDDGGEATDEEIIEIASKKIATISESERKFRFVSAFAFGLPDGTVSTGRGELLGDLTLKLYPNPPHGFPYRTFWWIPRFNKYFLDLTPEEQAAINHNKVALDQLRPAIEAYLKS